MVRTLMTNTFAVQAQTSALCRKTSHGHSSHSCHSALAWCHRDVISDLALVRQVVKLNGGVSAGGELSYEIRFTVSLS